MLRKFWGDRRGNYAVMTALAMLPLMGGLSVAVDYAAMTRERNLSQYALDAAAIATARAHQASTESKETQAASLQRYATEAFRINANGLDVNHIALNLVLPNSDFGGGIPSFTPDSLQAVDSAGNKSTYNAYGYAKLIFKQSGFSSIPLGRIFQGTSSSIPKTTYTDANYTNAMNEHFKALCDNAKSKKVMVMTVALDLNASKAAEKTQIDLLKACASDSRYRKDGQGKPAKLFWNSTGASLSEDFRKIGDELSNLRIVG